jgi:hypothetical protein
MGPGGTSTTTSRNCYLNARGSSTPSSIGRENRRQIVAPRFEEPLILRAAKTVQSANPIGWPPASDSD